MSYNNLCGLFEKSRQAYYKQIRRIEKVALQEAVILAGVRKIRGRAKTSRWGVRKILPLVNIELASMGFRIGRDRLFDTLRAHNMLVRPRKRAFFTTDSHHWLRKYDNLIQAKKLKAPNQVWVSDITYIKDSDGVTYFLYLITDAYSQKIVGSHLSLDLKADSAVVALRMAISANKGRLDDLIHHSDRGVQYCSEAYTKLLHKHEITISMARPGSPQENAIAERINGILKEEWLYEVDFGSLRNGRRRVKQVIDIYNTYRPHNTLDNHTPEHIHSLEVARPEAVRILDQSYTYRTKSTEHAHTVGALQ